MRSIDKAGIYADFSDKDYFRDPCPLPSFTQSLGKLLLESSPRHAWYAHPKLNPAWQQNDDPKYDVAHGAHALLLGRGREIEVIDAPDYRKKEAQQRKGIIRNMGKIPLLAHVYERAIEMRDACLRQMDEAGVHFFDNGQSEVMLAWQEAGTWMRSKLDRLDPEATIYDYKTTQGSAAPGAVAFKVADEGWDIQSAMYERGLVFLRPDLAGRVRQVRLVQETFAPFALNVSVVDEGTTTVGRQKLDVALSIWRQCMHAKRWPTYNDGHVGRLSIPGYALQRWQERMVGMVNPETGEVTA
jgi:hypothetical protein